MVNNYDRWISQRGRLVRGRPTRAAAVQGPVPGATADHALQAAHARVLS